MTEAELLNKIARTAIASRKAQRALTFHSNDRYKQFGRFPNSEAADKHMKEVLRPAREKAKELKRQLDGYLFMYEQKEWTK